ncbi:MAG: AraC family transcriptional regulator [Bacteroidales bacterium]|nr:AraC family transcriptional regulator [Bacteroidales bacterium]
MESLVWRFVRRFSRKETAGLPSELPLRDTEKLEKALEKWVSEKGYRRPHRTVNETARELGTDGVTLHHYFLERKQVDFRTWRTRLRLEEACRLLLEEPGTCASDIGLRVGFSNRSNFARQFRDRMGCTPGEWRSNCRENLLSLHVNSKGLCSRT